MRRYELRSTTRLTTLLLLAACASGPSPALTSDVVPDQAVGAAQTAVEQGDPRLLTIRYQLGFAIPGTSAACAERVPGSRRRMGVLRSDRYWVSRPDTAVAARQDAYMASYNQRVLALAPIAGCP